jgi:dolichol kinase
MSQAQKRSDWARLCVHIPPGLLTILIIQVVQVAPPTAWGIFLPLVCLILCLDGIRLGSYYKCRWIEKKGKNDLFSRAHCRWYKGWERRLLGSVLREKELGMLSAMLTYALGIAVIYACFDECVVVPAIVFLAFGDPAARVVGEEWGKPRQWLLGKSLLGCTACFIAACMGAIVIDVVAIWYPLYPSGISLGHILLVQLVGAVVATLTEAISPYLDNFTIQVAAAAAMWAVL